MSFFYFKDRLLLHDNQRFFLPMYITLNHLKEYKGLTLAHKSKRKKTLKDLIINLFESTDEFNKIKEFSEYQTSVFLSHKHDEGEVLEKSILLLQSLDVRVYIDWLDEQMPLTTSRETAELIKVKIKECSKFIFLATSEAVESKWCNWELGFGDSIKYPNSIAVMPIASDEGNWKGYEYLDIYPIVKLDENKNYCVEFKNKQIDLASWLLQ
ncbi:MAG: TIR domain-containing protein [Bacteroidetes bacterium]|nr:TIR domain-containing protein [Bacteroidota bacterium]